MGFGGALDSNNIPGVGQSRAKARKIGLRPNCESCGVGEGEALVVHHVDFNPLNNAKDNLKTLCHTCHGMAHRGLPIKRGPKPRYNKTAAIIMTSEQWEKLRARAVADNVSVSQVMRRALDAYL